MTKQSTILISGASRRLGLFLTRQFLANGCRVIALTRSISTELAECEQLGDVSIYALDYYCSRQVKHFIEQIKQKEKSVDAIIHNASTFETDGAIFSAEHYQSMFLVHMALPAQLNLGLLPLLNQADETANIVHITDIFAENPNPNYALYCSTKAAAENLAKGFAKKYAPKVRVNTIQPGPIKFLPSHSEEAKTKVLAETLLSYEGGFMPVFQAITAILENPYMTGASIKVDGGRALGRG